MLVDTIFTHAKVYNIFTQKWVTTDVSVLAGKIFYVGDAEGMGLHAKDYVPCNEKPLIPGMIDIHLHIESSLCTPETFAKAVLSHGVTTVVSEPHEIANVFGIAGFQEMIRVSKDAVIDIYYGIPSSVPSTSQELETNGGSIEQEHLAELTAQYPNVICLGEVMNYGSLLKNFEDYALQKKENKTMALISFMKEHYPLAAIEGHCPSVKDMDLVKLLFMGIDSDHCLQDIEGLAQRFSQGMFVELQEKSITPEIITYLRQEPSSGLYAFVTDDVPPDILYHKGHLDTIVRKALALGLPLEQAIIASSYAPALRMGFRDRGVIAPGRIADIILLKDNTADFQIEAVYKKGVLSSSLTNNDANKAPEFGAAFTNSLNISLSKVLPQIFTIPLPEAEYNQKKITCRVMRKNSINTYTQMALREFRVQNNCIDWYAQRKEINLVVVIDRYSGQQSYSQGFIDGVHLSMGAFCSSYAHDGHNLLIAGDSPEDMETALRWVVSHKGGMCCVSRGEILGSLALPIGGILSEAPLQELAEKADSIQNALKNLGFNHQNPIMSLCTLTLPVSPEIKITDKGLIAVHSGEKLSLCIDEHQSKV